MVLKLLIFSMGKKKTKKLIHEGVTITVDQLVFIMATD